MIIDEETLQDIINIELGLFAPLEGFMDSKDYRSVVDDMRLSDGTVFPIPITLDTDKTTLSDEIVLEYNEKPVAKVYVEDIFKIKNEDIFKIYKTNSPAHPGVKKELQRGVYRVGGKIELIDKTYLQSNLNPKRTKELFDKHKTVVGFQTRNAPHRAHEYLQRLGLEFCDALFINPLTGWKKEGDFNETAVLRGYEALIDRYYSGLDVYFDVLKTPMRYAGPKEAIFHAIIRKNLGCTHFIIGRDHAGVGDFYGKYEAHELAKELQKDLDIELLLFKEPFYCHICESIVSENCCKHQTIEKISGTKLREMLTNKHTPPHFYMRKEVFEALMELDEIFIGDKS